MATNLQFINQTKATSVSSLTMSNCFSSAYDVYYINVSLDLEGAGMFEIQFLDTSDSVITGDNYDVASLDLKDNASYNEYKAVDQIPGVGLRGIGAYLNDGDGYGFIGYIYYPFDSSKFTFMHSQSASTNAFTSGFEGAKAMGVHKQAVSVLGFKIKDSGGNTFNYIDCSIYGVT